MDQEEYLIFQIEELKKAYVKAIEPYVNRLMAIRSTQVPSYTITAEQYAQLAQPQKSD